MDHVSIYQIFTYHQNLKSIHTDNFSTNLFLNSVKLKVGKECQHDNHVCLAELIQQLHVFPSNKLNGQWIPTHLLELQKLRVRY